MFISGTQCLPAILWAGSAHVTHTDGTSETVHNVKVLGADRSPYGCKTAWPPKRKRKGPKAKLTKLTMTAAAGRPSVGGKARE